jgi:type III pantothenate kinase
MRRLAVILGNSTCRLVLLDDVMPLDERSLPRAELDAAVFAEALDALAGEGEAAAVEGVLCSVVPAQEDMILRCMRERLPGRVAQVRSGGARGMAVHHEPVESLGADRYCGALAARELAGAPCVVVDCGTAVTVNAVDARGDFAGGAITPGARAMFVALHASTALLPDVEADGPHEVPAHSTGEAIRAGVLTATRGAVEGLVDAMRRQMTEESDIRSIPVLITGGGAPLLLRAGLAVTGLRHEPQLLAIGAILYLRMSG